MGNKKGQSTGPKTVAGKAKSSKNASKASIFSKGYLPWEDLAEKQTQLDALAEQWQAHDPSRQLLLRTIEQSQLGMERMMYAERLRIEGRMQSLDIARQFCQQAGFTPLEDLVLPSWYFMDGDGDGKLLKNYAIEICRAYEQAKDFRDNYIGQTNLHVEKQFPELYRYVLEGSKAGTTFLIALAMRYKQSTPGMNFAVLIKEMEKDYRYYIRWGQDSVRYQTIIDGIRGEQMLLAMDLNNSIRYATNFQNRIIKGFTGLAALNQLEQQQEDRQALADQTVHGDLLIAPSSAPDGSPKPDLEEVKSETLDAKEGE